MGRGRGGSEEAFATAFAAERDQVVGLAHALVGDAELAEDLAADAFARAYEQWRRGRVDHLPGYVRQAVVNAARDHIRRAQRRRRHEARRGGDDPGVAEMAEAGSGPDAGSGHRRGAAPGAVVRLAPSPRPR